jgi:hypothetical protein
MNSSRHPDTLRNGLKHFLNELYPWATSRIQLPNLSDWVASQSREINSGKATCRTLVDLFPGRLFFFVDGTILEIFKPDTTPPRGTQHRLFRLTFGVKMVRCRGGLMERL